MNRHLLFLLLVLSFSNLAFAELRLAKIFQDHMVLQQEKPVPIWGWADAGATVKVSFASQEKSATADPSGRWQVVLDPLSASKEPRSISVSGSAGSHTIEDVLVGEVWICAGQSNMARPLRNDSIDYPRFKEYQQEAEYPIIRYFDAPTYASDSPMEDLDPVAQEKAAWVVLNNRTSVGVMSIPFFFAKELVKELDVPVGLVQVAVSGTPLTAWMPKEAIDSVAAAHTGAPDYSTAFASAEASLAKASELYKDWAGYIAANEAWRTSPTGPWPGSNQIIPDYPSVLYNALIHPLAPGAIRGVVWHQGESGPGPKHKELLMAMVEQWRERFQQDFHFIWGSLTRNTSASPPMEPALQSVRGDMDEEFLLASQSFGPEGNAVLVNFFDLGNMATHWARKEEAGKRMAAAALTTVYKKEGKVYSGPELVEATIHGRQIRAKFKNVGGGLVYEPSVDGISGFIIEEAAATPVLRWAEVSVEGDSVILSHPDVQKPTNAYYGWHPNPHETLFNREGFPAYRFRAVPRGRYSKGTEGPALVEVLDAPANAELNLSHVRRHGYIFNVVQLRGPGGKARVRARIPSEWKDASITSKGQPVEAGDLKTEGSARFYEFEVDVNGADVIVANSASPPDFSAVERF